MREIDHLASATIVLTLYQCCLYVQARVCSMQRLRKVYFGIHHAYDHAK